MTSQPFHGVLVPVLTPFTPSGEPDAGRFIAFCHWLLDQGVGGLSVFGTTSEANSMSGPERMALLDALIEAGIPAEKLMPGTGACSISEAASLVRHAVGHGCGGVLMLPPFYYKAVSDDGLFRSYAEVIERVADRNLRIYLYHIPPVSQIALSPELIERLLRAYPGTVAGIKDSSGDWKHTQALLERFQGQG
ncbi:MAG: dihydrodipicolinate synthase family protein, partial [Stellaceae bacterium]